MSGRWIVLLGVLALGACSRAPTAGTALAKLDTDLPMNEFMGHVVDPGSQMYWKNAGTMVDMQGEHSLYPTTQEGWDVLVSGASIVMEAGNALQLGDRPRAPQADWDRYAQQLTERAKIAREAAEKKDQAAVFEAGAKMYEVCVGCHEQFVIQPDIKANGPAKGNPLPAWPKK